MSQESSPPASGKAATIAAEAESRTPSAEVDARLYDSMLDVYKGAVDRAQSAAELVQKSAGAVGTIYAGLLALAFSVTDNSLPARATIPGLFLGFAIAFSTAYLAYRRQSGPDDTSGPTDGSISGVSSFGTWIAGAVNRRSYALRVSVLALGLGVALLPLPFLTINEGIDRTPAPIPTPPVIPANAPPGTTELLELQYQVQLDEYTAARGQDARLRARRVDLPLAGRTALIELVSWSVAVVGLAVMLLVPAIRFSGKHSAGPGIPSPG